MSLTLSSIHVYPVKSLGGFAVEQARTTARGLEHDRRWMLVDFEGRFISQREVAAMACLHCAPSEGGFSVTDIRTNEAIQLPWSIASGAEKNVRVWTDTVSTISAAEELSKWFAQRLGIGTQLVFMPDESARAVDPEYAEGIVSFADGFPYLIISQASLDDLNKRLSQTIPMDRFRPSLVVAGSGAFQEDEWRNIQIGEVAFSLVKPCARCVIPNTDQRTGERSAEPLRTLATYRKDLSERRIGKVDLGMNALSGSAGVIRVGDPITVLRSASFAQ